MSANNSHPTKNSNTKKKNAVPKKKKMTNKEKAKFSKMNQIDWVPFDPYGDLYCIEINTGHLLCVFI